MKVTVEEVRWFVEELLEHALEREDDQRVAITHALMEIVDDYERRQEGRGGGGLPTPRSDGV